MVKINMIDSIILLTDIMNDYLKNNVCSFVIFSFVFLLIISSITFSLMLVYFKKIFFLCRSVFIKFILFLIILIMTFQG